MKRYTIILLLTAFLFTSCEGFLTQKPTQSTTTDMALNDYNGLAKAIVGAYGPLASTTWYGANLVLESEIRAGNAMNPIVSDFQSGRYQVPMQMNYNESSTSGLWTYVYYVTAAVNNVLSSIEEKGADHYITPDVTQADLDNLKAEALFLRALAHFDGLRVYAHSWSKKSVNPDGIPVILKTDATFQEKPARNTIEEVYTQVLSDLTTAETLISDDFKGAISGTSTKASVSKGAIQALLSRVYLYKQDWQKAADYATKVIESGEYTLWTAEEYPTVWGVDAAADGGEVIFEVYGNTSNDYDGYWEGPSHMTNPNGYADCAATFELVGLFEEGDVRGVTGIRGTDEGVAMFCTDPKGESQGQMWTMKYQGKGLGDAKSKPDVNNTIVIRLSEMYLNRAEAQVNGATVAGTSAVADINAIRENRGASPLTSVGQAAVALERRLELNFEGHLWFDLARTNSSVTYADERTVQSISADSHYWALPIPKREIEVNENIKQNPGY